MAVRPGAACSSAAARRHRKGTPPPPSPQRATAARARAAAHQAKASRQQFVPANKSHSPSAFAVLAGLCMLLARAATCRPCEYIMSSGFHGELASSGALLPPVEGAPISSPVGSRSGPPEPTWFCAPSGASEAPHASWPSCSTSRRSPPQVRSLPGPHLTALRARRPRRSHAAAGRRGHRSRGAVPRAQVGCSGAAGASGPVRDRIKHQHDQVLPPRRSRRCARRTPLPAHRTTQASVLTRLAARRRAHPCSPCRCPCRGRYR